MFNVKQFSLNSLSGFQISIVLLPLRGRRGCIQDGPNIRASKTPMLVEKRFREFISVVWCDDYDPLQSKTIFHQ